MPDAKPPPRRPPGNTRTLPPAAWMTVAQTPIAETPIFRVTKRRMRHTRKETEGDFFIIEAPDWAQALALTPRQELILVRQYRFGAGKLSWEVPGGVIEAKETPLAAAQRELLEETGHAGQGARLLGSAAPNPAIQANRVHFVLIENCVMHAPLSWDPHEELQVAAFPLASVRDMVRKGDIFHSLCLNALQFLELHLADTKTPLRK